MSNGVYWCPQEQRSIEVKGSFAQWTHLTFPNDLPVDALSERTFRRQEVLSCFRQFGSTRVPIYLFISSLNINLAGLKQSPQSLEFMDTGQGREHASPPSSAPESRSLGRRPAMGPTCGLVTLISQVAQLLVAVEEMPKKGLKGNQVFKFLSQGSIWEAATAQKSPKPMISANQWIFRAWRVFPDMCHRETFVHFCFWTWCKAQRSCEMFFDDALVENLITSLG